MVWEKSPDELHKYFIGAFPKLAKYRNYPANLVIKLAGLNKLDDMFNLYQQFDGSLTINDFEIGSLFRFIKGEIKQRKCIPLVALLDKHIIGAIFIIKQNGKPPLMRWICVDKEYRHQNIAICLYLAVLKYIGEKLNRDEVGFITFNQEWMNFMKKLFRAKEIAQPFSGRFSPAYYTFKFPK